jgi:acetyl esterase/lipase
MLGRSMTTQASRDVVVRAEALHPLAAMFLGEHGNARDPLAAPLYGDYRGVAPIYIQVGGDETLLDDSDRLADHARAAGADVKLDVFPEMQHVFQLSVGNMPEATDAVQRLGAWFKLKLHL